MFIRIQLNKRKKSSFKQLRFRWVLKDFRIIYQNPNMNSLRRILPHDIIFKTLHKNKLRFLYVYQTFA